MKKHTLLVLVLVSAGFLTLSNMARASCSAAQWKIVIKTESQAGIKQFVKDHHCDINDALDSELKTALIYAVEQKNLASTRGLLAAGADVNGDGYDGQTPLFYALANGDLAMVNLLVDQHADVTATTRFLQVSVLMYAVRHATPEIVAVLVKHGASLQDADKYNQTAVDYVKKLPQPKRAAMLKALKGI